MSGINLRNYRWPAEWEPHAATWVAWPVNKSTWPGIFERIPPAFAQFVANVACFEPVNILLESDKQPEAHRLMQSACETVGAHFDVRFIDIRVNDSWCRDYGPMFLNPVSTDNGLSPVILDWDYNAWGEKYPPWDADSAVAKRIAESLSLPSVRPEVVLEGGAVEGNGNGIILTTESCLLNSNRNTKVDRAKMEHTLRNYLGASEIVWLPGQGIIGDDTDGHIDQLARFVEERTTVAAAAYDEDAPEAISLRENRDALQAGNDGTLTVHELRMPSPKFQQGHRLPASYCNFYVCNGGVIVPTFDDSADDVAMQVLQNLFPHHKVIGVPAIDLVWGLGALHCLTQQHPKFVTE